MNTEEIDTDCTFSPTCPHCGFVDTDAEGYYNDENTDHGREQCTECNKWFTWILEVNPSFWTKKVDWVNEWKRYNKEQVQMADLKMMNNNKGS